MNAKLRRELKQVIAKINEQIEIVQCCTDGILDYTADDLREFLSAFDGMEDELSECWDTIQEVMDAEEESFDNSPESFQEQRQDQHDTIMDALEEALDGQSFVDCTLHVAVDTLEDCVEHIQEAIDA